VDDVELACDAFIDAANTVSVAAAAATNIHHQDRQRCSEFAADCVANEIDLHVLSEHLLHQK